MARTQYQTEKRARLVSLVQAGRLSLEAARAKAAKDGLGPLEEDADAADFDPLSKLRWSWPMVVVWIAWRDIDRVRRADPDWRGTTGAFHQATLPNGQKALVLRRLTPPTDSTLRLLEATSPPLVALDEAHRQLVERLDNGGIIAEGVRLDAGAEQISAGAWADLQVGDDFSFRGGGATYVQVRFRPSTILEEWPSPSGGPALAAVTAGANRRRPKLERAKSAIADLYPEGVPLQVDLTDGELEQAVGRHLGENAPSKDTILRAAGRRP